MYGYRLGEVELPKINPIKNSKITEWVTAPQERPVVLSSLGCHVKNVALPHPDPSDSNTLQAGVCKRFLMKPPKADRAELNNFNIFVRKWIRENLVPLDSHCDVSVETWLSKTSYPAWRKEQLLRKYNAIQDPRAKRLFMVKSFMKDECYPEYKHARAINSRTDEFKTLVGPIFKAIEKELFKLDWFIKKIPVKDRASYIQEKLGFGQRFFCSDYTAYESHFVREVMKACEWELYEYMTSALPDHEEFMYYVKEVIGGLNVCVFKYFKVEVEATRMSGEMNTSLGNGFSNLMLMLYLSEKAGLKNITGVVEGDDGLFTGIGPFPKSEDFEKLGFTIKIEVVDRLSDASFCGLVFDPEDRVVVTDPIAEMCSFGWTTAQYARASKRRKMELLRCKAISLAYQYGECPILNALARYGLRVTTGYRAKLGNVNEWERDKFLEAKMYAGVLKRDPSNNTRLLVERLYGITIENQMEIEKYLDGLNDLVELDLAIIDHLIPKPWKHYYSNYATTTKTFPMTNITTSPGC